MKHIDLIPLNKAVNCENCQQVSASTKTCVGCGSRALLSLSKVLNRPEKKKRVRKSKGVLELERMVGV